MTTKAILRTTISKDSVFLGTYAEEIENRTLLVTGRGRPELQKYLTVYNTSVAFQINQLKKQAIRNPYKAKEFEDQIKELSKDLTVTYYHIDEQGQLLIPIGFWFLCETVKWKNEERLTPYVPSFARDYQDESIRLLLAHKRAMIVLSTGLGKTIVIYGICEAAIKAGKRTCVIVPTVDLVAQTSSAIAKYLESLNLPKPPVVSGAGGMFKYKTACDVLVSTPITAAQYIDRFQVVTIDECLPYDQHVLTSKGGIAIGRLKKMFDDGQEMPLIASFNEQSKKIEYKKILYVWQRKDKEEIIVIKTNRLKTSCTTDHKILVYGKGWTEAKYVKKGDILVGPYAKGGKQDLGSRALNNDQLDVVIGSFLGDGHLSNVNDCNKYRLSIIHGEKQKRYLETKAKIFGSKVTYIEKNGYAQTPAYKTCTLCFDLDSEFPSNKKTCPQWILDKLNAKSLAIWFMDDGSTDQRYSRVTLSTHSFDFDSNVRISDRLHDFGIYNKISVDEGEGYKYYYIVITKLGLENLSKLISVYVHEDLDYKIPPHLRTPVDQKYQWNSKFEEFATYTVTETSVERRTERKKGRGYGLFDIEVEDNHNFVACAGRRCIGNNGVIVHNCHHSPASTWFALGLAAKDAEYFYGMTATPVRSDNMELGMHAWCGPVVINRSARWGIENKWLTPIEVVSVKVASNKAPLPDHYSRHVAYKWGTCNKKTAECLRRIIQSLLDKGNKVVVLFSTVKAGQYLSEYCKTKGLEFQVSHEKYKVPFF